MKIIFTLKVKHPTESNYRNVQGFFTRSEAIGTANNYLKNDYCVIIQPVQLGR